MSDESLYLYKCDPVKNVKCTKNSCGDPCTMTRHAEYADGGIIGLTGFYYQEVAEYLKVNLDKHKSIKENFAYLTLDPYGYEYAWCLRVSIELGNYDEPLHYSRVLCEQDIINQGVAPSPAKLAKCIYMEITDLIEGTLRRRE